MKNILFIGNSHLIALIDAAKRGAAASGAQQASDVRQEQDFEWRNVAFRHYDFNLSAAPGEAVARMRFILLGGAEPPLFVFDEQNKFSVSQDYLQELTAGAAQLGGSVDTVVSYFHGNEHSIFSMVEHPVPFDFFATPDDAPLPPASPPRGMPRQVVPLEAVRRELTTRAHQTVLYCQFLRRVFPGPEIVHVMPPPPIGDEQQLRKNPEIFARHFDVYGVAPPALRLKVYTLYAQILSDALRSAGVRVLTAPAEAQSEGYLHESMWMESTHANHLYGQHVLHELGAA